jgi:release factor glutamine methyltransferase
VIEGIKNNTQESVWKWFVEHITPHYEPNEAKAIARVIFEHYFNLSYSDLIIKKDRRFGESEIVRLYKAIKKLKQNIPVQYITGVTCFRDLMLKVSPDVLIPRPETEELVQWVVDVTRKDSPKRNLNIWDIGTGSGAIAISLYKELNDAKVSASDISEVALNIASENSQINKADVWFFQHDILNDPPPEFTCDIIISNPPYVKESEKALMQKNVLDYEPAQALYVPDDDPLLYYKAIARCGSMVLRNNGIIFVELNEALGNETMEVFKMAGFKSVSLKKDINGKHRFLKAALD